MLKSKETGKVDRERADIMEELENLRERIEANEAMFNLASDNELIEAMIYEQKSLHARFAYLLKIAREKDIRIDFLDRQQ